ncbi:FAS1 domain-containing protein fsc1 [Neolecta irregularis DAH-3]|uniref:FAS1 domain-containing protein fsc1 n=1 Tax=Neolecta irregularis (strain DAH-3) TaxID=1198029 RepID=A0A1U7LWT4_NEOID|nr:FAS1 domain-containing protein fsc1 [Neolecta irregularis DAH-3]|eukprot:OLL27033.1 FAS1 domain-containing protein fsc1 [Neolecta irregularis DAH-3]
MALLNSFNRIDQERDQKQESTTQMTEIHAQTVSIIDLLSSDPQFKSLLRALQHAGLISDINISRNITLVAPTNDAFEAFEPDGILEHDLWRYHILNTTNTINSRSFVADTWLQINEKANLGIHVDVSESGIMAIGNSKVIKENWNADNGVIQVIDKLLSLPPSTYEFVETSSDLKLLFSISNYTYFDRPASTLFAPNDKAFSVLSQVEIAYLCTSHGSTDLQKIIDRHILENIVYRQDVPEKLSLRTVEGENITLEVKEKSFTVDGVEVEKPDVLTNQGHIVNRLSIPRSYEFTPLKGLYGLGSDTFAQCIIKNGITELVNTRNRTIFAPVDSPALDFATSSGDPYLSSLSYNIIPGTVDLDDLEDGHLLETEFRPRSMNGNSQRIKISKHRNKLFINTAESTGNIAYIEKYDSRIYEVSNAISIPLPFPFAATPDLSVSKSLEFINQAGLEDELYINEKSLTLLLPTNLAWERLGLVQKLVQSNDTLLKHLILNTAVQLDKILYSQDISKTSIVVKTRLGEKIKLWNQKGEIKLQHGSKNCKLVDRDILAANGVGHSLTCIPIPTIFSISPQDLLVAGKASKFIELITKANLLNVLDLDGNYSILAPTDAVLEYEDINEDTIDIEQIIRLHILKPSSDRDENCEADPFRCLTAGESLNGLKVATRKLNSDLSLIHIEGDRHEQSARILDRGSTSQSGQVIILDRVLRPAWLVIDDPPTGKLIGIGFAIATGVFLSILIIALMGSKIMTWRKRRSPEWRPLLGEDDHSEYRD